MVDPKSGKYDLLPHVAPGNIESFTGRLYDNVKLVGEENLISGKFVFNVGDIVYGKINPQLGKYVFARFSGLTSADAYVLNAKNGIVQKFLYAVIQTRDFYDYSVSVSKRSGMPKINRDELNAYSYWAPSESEQLKIGEYLLTLDHLITLHQRQHFLHSTPDISLSVRLIHPFYTSSWEQRKLGDIASDMVAGGDIDKDLILAEGQYPVIANALTGDGIVGYYDKEYRVNAPAVTVTGRGDVGHAKARLVNFTPVVRLLSVKSEHDVFFLENVINTLKIVIESTGVPQLTVPQLAKYEVAFPRQLDEEEHIGAFFKQLDHLITLHQRKGKAAVSGCSNDANNSKGVCCKARDFGYKCHKKDEPNRFDA